MLRTGRFLFLRLLMLMEGKPSLRGGKGGVASREGRVGAAKASVAPPVLVGRLGRERGVCGGAGSGCGRARRSGWAVRRRRWVRATGRGGRARSHRTGDSPADVDHGPAGAGCPVAQAGSDGHVGELFDAPGSWRISWSFSCQKFAMYGGGNFKLSGDGDFQDVSLQRFGVRGGGTLKVTGGGRGRLVIESVCDRWAVKAAAG